MIRFIYNLLWPLGLVFFLPGYLVKMFRRGNYREKFGQRLGIYDSHLRARLYWKKSFWLHAVSVGEVTIALKLARQIRILKPDLHCVLTTTTTTGFAFANQNAPEWMEVMYSPLDFWPIMRRAFATISPKAIILVEAEVWPNLVAEAHTREIAIALVNARLSPRSEKRFRMFRRLVAPTFRLLDAICVQNLEDIERWKAIGAEEGKINHIGSIKYDPENVEVDPETPVAVLAGFGLEKRTVIFGGSTHSGEEKVLAEVFRALRRDFVDLLLVLAPRHTERTAEIQRDLEGIGFHVALRSQLPVPDPFLDCLLIDSTGELRDWYGVATLAFIGKSLLARGGQNPAEAILAGKPVLFGPHMENFAVLANTLVTQGGALQVNSATELRRGMSTLLANPDDREEMAQNARKALDTHRGATARTAQLIVDLTSTG
ncbi:MAG TPA: 3-deoxy-D-manno-octulosonic acid transferase [Chthoniobacterales bacterium]|jgi:3-deoxy-D-manno-octulosonic-acid transferase|nr:3-deoxy-D-manno-octulosonic acid transferase [Chthoniobacterales bacterium]